MNVNYVPDPWGADRSPTVAPATQETSLLDLPNLLSTVLRWWWLVLVIVVLTTLLFTVAAAVKTPLYRASATLELNPAPAQVVDSRQPRERAMYDEEFLALQMNLVKSRYLAERVARKFKFGADQNFLGYAPENPSPELAVGSLMGALSVSGTTSNRVMRLSFVHTDPAVAARVANAYAEEAVAANFDRAHEATARSRAFLQKRLEVTGEELKRAERQLIDYTRQANIINVVADDAASNADSAGGTLLASNLLALNEQLAEAQNARIVAEQLYARSGSRASSAAASDSNVKSLENQRAELQAENDRKLEKYSTAHPEMTGIQAGLTGLDDQISKARRQTTSAATTSLRDDFIAARNREQQLSARVEQLKSQMLELNDRGVQYTLLRRAVEAQRSMYNSLLARLGEENSTATRTSSVALIDRAQVPGGPFSPDVPRAMMLGLLVGLVLGGAAALGAERWRDTVNTVDDLALLELPVLGVIPNVESKKIDAELLNPRSSASEAYHSVRASLQFLSTHGDPTSLFVTSSGPGEGKTASVIAIARGLASVGKRVVVVDSDLRKPSFRGKGRTGGLNGILIGAATLEDELTETGISDLYLLHAGSCPPDPTVLLGDKGFAGVIRKLESLFDVVVIDGPPVLGLADAPLIASVAESTVLVIESQKVRRAVATQAMNRLRSGGATIAGAILTKFDQRLHRYGYGYGYGYGAAEGSDTASRDQAFARTPV